MFETGRERRVAIACGVTAVAVSGIAVVAAIAPHDWRPSVLVRMTHNEPMAALAREIDPSFVTSFQGHYDGVYFYAIALDPVGQAEAHSLIDYAAYRYGHPGYAWLGWLFALGNPEWVPAAFVIVSLLAIASAAALASALSVALGRSPWGGLLVALNPGLVYAVTADLSESVIAALITLALLAWLRDRLLISAFALVGLCLTKEPYALVPVGLGVWEAVVWLRGRRRDDLEKRAAALLVGPLALLLWQTYLRIESGQWSFASGPPKLTFPFAGWVEGFNDAVGMLAAESFHAQIGAIALPILAAVGTALLTGIARSVRVRNLIEPVFILQALLLFSATEFVIVQPKDGIRAFAVPLGLLAAVFAARPQNLEPKREESLPP